MAKAGFALRYISIFFTPSFVVRVVQLRGLYLKYTCRFVLLPLSPPIGGIEVATIIAVFREFPKFRKSILALQTCIMLKPCSRWLYCNVSSNSIHSPWSTAHIRFFQEINT